MKKINLLKLTIGIFLSGMTLAQKVEVVNGAPFKIEKKNESIENVLNTDRDNISFLTKKRKKYKLVTLDKNLSLESSKLLELPEVKGKEVKYIKAEKLGDKTYFFSRSWDKKNDTYTLYASELNLKTSKFDKHIEVLKVKDKKFGSLWSPFSIVRSIDSSKVMFGISYPTKEKENARYGFVITDNNMNELWRNDIEFDELDKNFTLDDFLVDKEGNIHVTANVRMDRDEKKKKGASSRYYLAIYTYKHELKKIQRYDIGFKDEVILSNFFKVNEANELVCTGFYGEKKLFDAGMKGFFFMRLDPVSMEVKAKNLSPFDKKFLGQLMSDRKAEKGKGLTDFYVRETFNLSDGGMAVVTEKYEHYQTEDGNGNVTSEVWIYGDVVIYFLDKEGKMKTYSILKKKQIARNVYNGLHYQLISMIFTPTGAEVPYYGIGCTIKDDKIQLVYNENPKNEARLKAGKKPKSVRQRTSTTNLVQFDANGKIESSTLFKSKDKDAGYKMPVMPRNRFLYGEGKMILVGQKGKNMRVVDLRVK